MLLWMLYVYDFVDTVGFYYLSLSIAVKSKLFDYFDSSKLNV